MSELWNLWEIKPPPTCKVEGILYRKEMLMLKNILFDILKTLKSVSHLDREAAILSRLLYRSKRQFRHDKGMQYIVQIYQCLKRYLKLDLYGVIKNYKSSLPEIIPQNRSQGFLPTRHMLEWVLLRLQAFSKLFVRMLNLGKSAGPLIYGKLCLGWSIKTTFVTFGLISRLLALSKFFVIKSIEWYDSLHEYLPYFKSTTDFLRGHEFPAHLKQWIGDVDLSPPAKKTTVDEVFEIFNLVAPNKEDDCDDVDIIRSTFFKTAKEITTDSDVKEVEVKKMRSVKSEEEEKNKASYVPDLGIPVAKRQKKNFEDKNWNSRNQWKQKYYSRQFRRY